MPHLTIELPDELARSFARITATRTRASSNVPWNDCFLTRGSEPRRGSAAAVLRAMKEPPHLSGSDVDALDAAIAAGRLPVQTPELF